MKASCGGRTPATATATARHRRVQASANLNTVPAGLMLPACTAA